ncbi:hypothetical protein ACODT5_12825 [Streptomyces sp. 5.8]|uniref:hypothetical protein n=1 Tax=Streptomyces sp. 5.8 TaxID=3406571 RepID=UPI003BB785BD
MVLDLVEDQFDLSPLPVEGNQFARRVLLVVQQGGAKVHDSVALGEGDGRLGFVDGQVEGDLKRFKYFIEDRGSAT